MAKFYIQSGTLRSVVQSESPRKAALWAVHEAMQQVLPLDGDAFDTLESAGESVSSQSIAVLSSKLMISERGFDRRDATTIPTLEVVSEWNQMVTTLDRLQRMLYRAA